MVRTTLLCKFKCLYDFRRAKVTNEPSLRETVKIWDHTTMQLLGETRTRGAGELGIAGTQMGVPKNSGP